LARFAHQAFDRLMSAVSSPHTKRTGAAHDFNIKIDSGIEDILAKEPQAAGLIKGNDAVLDGQWILTAHVDDTLVGADGDGGNDQTFDDGMRVPSSTLRSMYAPGSPSSALQTMYLLPVLLREARARSHLTPVGKPAPPRPRIWESLISLTTQSGSFFASTFCRPRSRPVRCNPGF